MRVKPTKRSGAVLLEIDRSDEPLMASTEPKAFQLKRILVPIDFSDCATKALRYALPFASEHAATIALLYVVPTLPYGFGEDGFNNYAPVAAEMSTRGKKALEAFAAKEVGKQARFEIAVRNGSPSFEIAEFARSLPADLIVMSTHGYSGFKHVLIGSVAEHVVRHAPCPVLVVREHEHEFLRTRS